MRSQRKSLMFFGVLDGTDRQPAPAIIGAIFAAKRKLSMVLLGSI